MNIGRYGRRRIGKSRVSCPSNAGAIKGKDFTCSLLENTDKSLGIDCVDAAGTAKLSYKKGA